MKANQKLFKFLKEHSLLTTEGNVFYAERAFKVNSIFNWFDKHKNKVSRNKMISLLRDYLDNEIDIIIRNDKLMIVRKRELAENE